MKTILVATDLSTRSDRAVHRAIRLARARGVPCHVVSVVDNDLPADLLKRLTAEYSQRLAAFVKGVASVGQEVTTSVLAGDPQEMLLQEAERLDADLVVLGTHRRRPILDLLRDSTMVGIVRAARRPVLLVKELPSQDYRRVVVPVSFSPACTAAMHAAMQIAPDADFSSFHAVPIPFSGLTGDGPASPMAQQLCADAEAERDAWRQSTGLGPDMPEVEVLCGSRTQAMERLTAADVDLIAAGAHTRSGFAPNVLGSFVTELIHNPPCDVLVCRAR